MLKAVGRFPNIVSRDLMCEVKEFQCGADAHRNALHFGDGPVFQAEIGLKDHDIILGENAMDKSRADAQEQGQRTHIWLLV